MAKPSPAEVLSRETKIGLLVGAAFIAVMGILLADHFGQARREGERGCAIEAPWEAVAEPIVTIEQPLPAAPMPVVEPDDAQDAQPADPPVRRKRRR